MLGAIIMINYCLDVGVLLSPEDEFFECYEAYDNDKYGFYDENQIAYLDKDKEDAISYGKAYVENGVDGTYAVLTDQGECENGNDSDFDLIISANAKDLDNIISLTETEKGRLLSRWIGLSIIEDKDIKAREKWNKEISVGRFSDMYNQVQLESDIENLTTENKHNEGSIKALNEQISTHDKSITENQSNKDMLLSSMREIDTALLKVDDNGSPLHCCILLFLPVGLQQ